MKVSSSDSFNYEHYASLLLKGGHRDDVLDWKASALAGIIPSGYSFSTALEVGCAEGIVLNKIGRLLQIKKCFGLDVSETFLSEAKKRYPHITFIHSRSETLPFPDQSMDLIILSDIIEHIENLSLFFQEVRRVGKYILVKLPVERYWWRTLVSGPLKRAPQTGQLHPDGHLHVFSKRSFLHIIRQKGFRIVARKIIYYFDNYPQSFPNRFIKIRWSLDRFLKIRFPGSAHRFFGGTLLLFARTQ